MTPATSPGTDSCAAAPTQRDWSNRWSQAVDDFVAVLAERGYSEFTRRDYRLDCLRLGARVGKAPERLDAADLARVEADLERDGVSLTARRRRVSAYHGFHEFLRSRAGAQLTGAVLLGASGADEDRLDRLLVGLIYLAGLRPLEVAQLEGRDLRCRRELIVSRVGLRMVPMHPAILDLLREAREVVPQAAYRPVLPGLNGFPANARTLHGRFQRFVERLGHPWVRPETLRREVSGHLRRLGTPAGMVKAFLGKDQGRPVAPRRGGLIDLTSLRAKIRGLPVDDPDVEPID